MHILNSQLMGMPVRLSDTGKKVTRILMSVVEAETGKLLGFLTMKGLVISPVDVLPFRGEAIEIRSQDVLISPHELVRLRRMPLWQWRLVGKKVFTKKGRHLGKITDHVLNLSSMRLEQIVVTKKWLGLITLEERIFNQGAIVEILPDRVIVKNDHGADRVLQDHWSLNQQLNSPAPMTRND